MTKRILVVDDNQAVLQVVANMLVANGHTVKTADTIQEGFVLAMNEQPDLVIADYRLREGTGLELIKLIGSTGTLSHTQYVIMTGFFIDISQALWQAFEFGEINGLLQKPFTNSELMALV